MSNIEILARDIFFGMFLKLIASVFLVIAAAQMKFCRCYLNETDF